MHKYPFSNKTITPTLDEHEENYPKDLPAFVFRELKQVRTTTTLKKQSKFLYLKETTDY